MDIMMAYLSRANKLWLAAGLLCMFGYIWFEGYALVHICRTLGYQSAKRQGTVYGAADVFFPPSLLPPPADSRPACFLCFGME